MKILAIFSSAIKSHKGCSWENIEQVEPSDDKSFFFRTLEAVGGLVKDDVKLGTLYCTLILATPGSSLSDASRVGT